MTLLWTWPPAAFVILNHHLMLFHFLWSQKGNEEMEKLIEVPNFRINPIYFRTWSVFLCYFSMKSWVGRVSCLLLSIFWWHWLPAAWHTVAWWLTFSSFIIKMIIRWLLVRLKNISWCKRKIIYSRRYSLSLICVSRIQSFLMCSQVSFRCNN